MNRLAPYLLICVAIATLQALMLPSLARYWWPSSLVKAIDGMIFGIWGVLTLAWILVAIAGLLACGRRGLWLFLTAPLGLMPLFLLGSIFFVCIGWGECL
jgi:hypothetical protein